MKYALRFGNKCSLGVFSIIGRLRAARISAMRDALAYLPSGRVVEVPKAHTVYHASQGDARRIFLVLSGRVRIDRLTQRGTHTLLHIADVDTFFGTTALIPEGTAVPESATAMDNTKLMSWRADEIDGLLDQRPQLGIALCEYFIRRNSLLRERLTIVNEFKTDARVMIALVQLATQYGVPRSDGARCVSRLTHSTIAAYVGTSREIVTVELNRLRRLGYVEYSRLHTDIYVEALLEWMRHQGIPYSSRLRLSEGGTAHT